MCRYGTGVTPGVATTPQVEPCSLLSQRRKKLVRFLSPFSITLRKSVLAFWSSLWLRFPLATLKIGGRASLDFPGSYEVLCGVRVCISAVHLDARSSSLTKRQRRLLRAQTYFEQNPWLTATSGEAETLCKRHICNTEAICSFCFKQIFFPDTGKKQV